MFIWTDRNIQWYQDAAVYTKHPKTVLEEMKDLFQINEEVYDLWDIWLWNFPIGNYDDADF